jgi:NAD(P)-dependent dehydrogenase (short-subunit alcohol dehydrogenase family)
MADDFSGIKLDFSNTLRTFFHSQYFGTPTYPTESFSGQTIIVTGANIGLGLEAARHFYRLNCERLILAVRTVSKGEAAKEDIVRSVKHRSDGLEAIEIWPLDLSSTKSTLAFADRVKKDLPRLDSVVENAGIVAPKWSAAEGVEMTVQVNVLNTFLLALLVLPKLTETKERYPASSPHLEIVSSEAHRFEKFPELSNADIYATLRDEKTYNGQSR